MILLDTSAWIEFLRATGSPTHLRVKALLSEAEANIATTDVVSMELLAGARDAAHEQALRQLLARCAMIPVEAPSDYEEAAMLYRRCRQKGETVRKLTDCLIAAVAIRSGCAVLHQDADFAALARCTALVLA